MDVGIWKPYDEEEYKKLIEAGKAASLGIEVNSLLDEIVLLEIQHNYDLTKVLSQVKLDLMTLLGKVKQEEEDKSGKKGEKR